MPPPPYEVRPGDGYCLANSNEHKRSGQPSYSFRKPTAISRSSLQRGDELLVGPNSCPHSDEFSYWSSDSPRAGG